jgi:hypothetical protein
MTDITIDISFGEGKFYHEFRVIKKKCEYKRLLEDVYGYTKDKIFKEKK